MWMETWKVLSTCPHCRSAGRTERASGTFCWIKVDLCSSGTRSSSLLKALAAWWYHLTREQKFSRVPSTRTHNPPRVCLRKNESLWKFLCNRILKNGFTLLDWERNGSWWVCAVNDWMKKSLTLSRTSFIQAVVGVPLPCEPLPNQTFFEIKKSRRLVTLNRIYK